MNTQEAYEAIREHFTRPGAEFGAEIDAEHEETRCVYRSNGDRTSPVRCAFGVLIPDELYEPVIEGDTVQAMLQNHPRLEDELRGVSDSFVANAQTTHDECAIAPLVTIGDFVTELDTLASNHGLTRVNDA